MGSPLCYGQKPFKVLADTLSSPNYSLTLSFRFSHYFTTLSLIGLSSFAFGSESKLSLLSLFHDLVAIDDVEAVAKLVEGFVCGGACGQDAQ